MEFAPDGPMAIPLWVNGHAFLTVTHDFYVVNNPATGEAIRRVPLAGAEEAAAAVGAARTAQPIWAEMGLNPRRVCLGNLADGLEKYAGQFSKLLREETGMDEAQAAADVANAVAALRGMQVGETGVVAVVVDATQPLARFAEAAAPLLLAGATVVVKPSPKAPSAIYALCELTARAEWPGGVLNLMQGDIAAIAGLCTAPVDRVLYAGEAALGEQVGAIVKGCGLPFAAV
jgi:acyl-CoA reductase-like NAD-dependent aldehyde dehydrogenase